MCVAILGLSWCGMILLSMVDETWGSEEMPRGETHHVYGVAKEAWLMAINSLVLADVGIW